MAQPIVQRVVFLTIFVILLLAVAGVTAAGPSGDDSTPSTTPERTSFGPAVSEDLERTVSGGASSGPDVVEEEFDENVPEPTVGLGKEHTLVDPVEEPGTADAVHGLNAGGPREYGRGVGRPERAGKPEERGDERESSRGEGQPKVTLCHKGKNTLTVGAPLRRKMLLRMPISVTALASAFADSSDVEHMPQG